MDFESDEKEIEKLTESLRIRKPPASLMKNYEEEVRKKIHSAEPTGLWAPPFALSLAGALVLLSALAFWLFPQQAKKPIVTPAPIRAAVQAPVSTETEKVLLEKLNQDLLILEMLGEDEGLLDDFNRIEGDADFLIPAPTRI